MLSVCTSAGEAGGCFVPKRRRQVSYGVGVPNPERARAEAARRARRQLRLYCASNRLNRLGTLTYAGAGCHDPSLVREHLGLFFRSLRDELGGKPFPYAWVPEWHPGGHGLHAHFAVGRFIKRSAIERAWGRGFVHVKVLGDLPVGSGTLGQSRAAAGYLSKYVSKSFTENHLAHRHRYDVAQGFKPERVAVWGLSAEHVIEEASALFGGHLPERRWTSAEQDDWEGPPALWVQWS